MAWQPGNPGQRGIFRWKLVEGEWSRRLLHIPIMTSIERQDGNYYGDHHEPLYNILTYTWGRWCVPNGPRLKVQGTSWTIPAVDESMFTVENFYKVIQKLGEVNQFAWTDIACIDQENYTVKMAEIGRQVAIFANANRVCAWLWRQPTNALQSSLDNIFYCSAHLQSGYREELDGDLRAVLENLKGSLDLLFDGWWFSSLWTLQEGVLRSNAMLLSRNGDLHGSRKAF